MSSGSAGSFFCRGCSRHLISERNKFPKISAVSCGMGVNEIECWAGSIQGKLSVDTGDAVKWEILPCRQKNLLVRMTGSVCEARRIRCGSRIPTCLTPLSKYFRHGGVGLDPKTVFCQPSAAVLSFKHIPHRDLMD